MLLHSIVYACRCARVQAEFETCVDEDVDEKGSFRGRWSGARLDAASFEADR